MIENRSNMKTAAEIATEVAASETFKGLTLDDLGLSVEEMMVAAIEADRAQRATEYADPAPAADEAFPDRPQHPDFARLSAAMLYADKMAESPLNPPEALGIDEDSLAYATSHRVGHGVNALGMMLILTDPHSALGGAWIDGFVVGMEYQRRGGSRPAETGTTAGEGSAQ